MAEACPSRDDLRQFLEQSLPNPAADRIEKHLNACCTCQALAMEIHLFPATSADPLADDAATVAPDPGAGKSTNGAGVATAEAPTLGTAGALHPIHDEEPAQPGGDLLPPPGFRLLRELGKGAFGSVWLARHLALDKLVAIKHLFPERVAANVDLLGREARTMAALKVHPNRVTVFDLIQTGAGWFLIMDYVAGGTLAQLSEPGRPLEWTRAARYIADVADGLAEVHARGLWHLDIKPGNILLDRDRDQAVLTDFGLASQAADAKSGCGTLGYMAPEIFDGKPTAKTDVFALAATLYRLVTGQPPFMARSVISALGEAQDGITEAALAALPANLVPIVKAGLDPDPDRRLSLAVFTARLRGLYTGGLAQRLRGLSNQPSSAVQLNVAVSTANERDLQFRTVFASTFPLQQQPPAVSEPPTADCDEVVRIEATATVDGYLTILNLSTSGELEVLFPNPRVPENRIAAGKPRRLTVRMTPPAGTDHAVLVWTPRPCPLSAQQWREQLETGKLLVPAAVDRGMDFVAVDSPEASGTDWVAAVVGIEHGGPA